MISDKNDKNIVRNAMIVLFLSLLIVYVIRYQTGWTTQTITPTNNTSITDALVISPVDTDTGITMTNPSTGEVTIPDIAQQTGLDTTGTNQTNEQRTGIIITTESKQSTGNTDMKILSWTTLYFGPIEWIDKLGINYNYALRDDRNIYFVSLNNEPDLSATARSLWWTLYTMNTETEIVRNELFGKRIIFINLPEYKDKLVLMYVEIGQERRLLQISYTIYHQSKRYLQTLFID